MSSTTNYTQAWMNAYNDVPIVMAPTFLSNMFATTPQSFHKAEKVVIDYVRAKRKVATPVLPGKATNNNDVGIYTTEVYDTPQYSESITINADTFLQKQPGVVDSVGFVGQWEGYNVMSNSARAMENSFRFAMELQASQIYQFGALDLYDNTNSVFKLDYGFKASHLGQYAASMDNSGVDFVSYIVSSIRLLEEDSYTTPNMLIVGANVESYLLKNDSFRILYETRNVLGNVFNQKPLGGGAYDIATLKIGGADIRIVGYGLTYPDSVTGLATPFIDPNKVILLNTEARFDKTFGGTPLFSGSNDVQSVGEYTIPTVVGGVQNNLGMSFNGYKSLDNKEYVLNATARPLLIPTAKDTTGCWTAIF